MYVKTIDENTGDGEQQSNPADAASNASAAKPDGETGTVQTPPDGQGEGDKAAAADASKTGDGSEGEQPQGAPEAYEAFELPEGFALEGERLEQAQGFFKELNLDQAQAQKAINLFTELTGKDSAALAEALGTAQVEARAQQITEWGTQSVTEFGDKFDGMVKNAQLAVSVLEAERPNLKTTFNEQGWGNHPDLIYVFNKFGSMLSESGMDTGGSSNASSGSDKIEHRMYPNM